MNDPGSFNIGVIELHSYFSTLSYFWDGNISLEKNYMKYDRINYLISFLIPPEVCIAFVKYCSFILWKLKQNSKCFTIHSDLWVWNTLYLFQCLLKCNAREKIFYNTFGMRVFIKEVRKNALWTANPLVYISCSKKKILCVHIDHTANALFNFNSINKNIILAYCTQALYYVFYAKNYSNNKLEYV